MVKKQFLLVKTNVFMTKKRIFWSQETRYNTDKTVPVWNHSLASNFSLSIYMHWHSQIGFRHLFLSCHFLGTVHRFLSTILNVFDEFYRKLFWCQDAQTPEMIHHVSTRWKISEKIFCNLWHGRPGIFQETSQPVDNWGDTELGWNCKNWWLQLVLKLLSNTTSLMIVARLGQDWWGTRDGHTTPPTVQLT